jgi:hypothetical protein
MIMFTITLKVKLEIIKPTPRAQIVNQSSLFSVYVKSKSPATIETSPAARIRNLGRLASLRMNIKYVGPPKVRSAAKKTNTPRMKPLLFFKLSRNATLFPQIHFHLLTTRLNVTLNVFLQFPNSVLYPPQEFLLKFCRG